MVERFRWLYLQTYPWLIFIHVSGMETKDRHVFVSSFCWEWARRVARVTDSVLGVTESTVAAAAALPRRDGVGLQPSTQVTRRDSRTV